MALDTIKPNAYLGTYIFGGAASAAAAAAATASSSTRHAILHCCRHARPTNSGLRFTNRICMAVLVGHTAHDFFWRRWRRWRRWQQCGGSGGDGGSVLSQLRACHCLGEHWTELGPPLCLKGAIIQCNSRMKTIFETQPKLSLLRCAVATSNVWSRRILNKTARWCVFLPFHTRHQQTRNITFL